MLARFVWLGFITTALMHSSTSAAATIMVESKSDDTVGQSIVYNLRNKIASSSIHKLVYNKDDAGFVISIVTLPESDGRSVYSAVLSIPPFDKKGLDYYVQNLVGYCGSGVTESCAGNILSGFDQDIARVSAVVLEALKKPATTKQ